MLRLVEYLKCLPVTLMSIDKIEALGCTGWNWKERCSYWLWYDFDSILNHSKGLSDDDLKSVEEKVKQLDYIKIIKSKSGKGLHLYIVLSGPVPTANHTEHAALGRSILSFISSEIGIDLKTKVDVCGGNLWIYHRNISNDGFDIIKDAKPFNIDLIPPNWRNHIEVVKGRSTRVQSDINIDEIAGSIFVTIDKEHRRLLDWFKASKHLWWWDSDRHMIVCHTYSLKVAKKELGLIGLYEEAPSRIWSINY
jgi:hypothetical protein